MWTCFNQVKYTFCNIKSVEHQKNLKNGPILYLGLIHVIKSQIHLAWQSFKTPSDYLLLQYHALKDHLEKLKDKKI
jgi:hypothetical protein